MTVFDSSALKKQLPIFRFIRFEKATSYLLKRVSKLLVLEPDEVVSSSKKRHIVEARSLASFWEFSELGLSQTELAQKFGVSQPAVSSAVRKGEKFIKATGYKLIENK